MTLSLISLLYEDIAESWLLLKKCTGVSIFFSVFLNYLIAGQGGIQSDNILLRKT